ncbi:MAG: YD repeat-containing protein [Phenylobacterium sp.]|jgi:YD repeat-containing protein
MNRLKTFCFWLLACQQCYQLNHQTVHAQNHQNQPKTVISEPMTHQVQTLNELSQRRRVNTFFANQQSVSQGLRQGFVNVGSGNVTFVRRDLVTSGRIPLVMARVYDSAFDASRDMDKFGDFGPGWQLSLAQTITINNEGILVYTNDNVVSYRFMPTATGYKVDPAQNSDIRAVEWTGQGLLQISYFNGLAKRFEKLGDRYRLVSITDNNGNQLQLSYTNNQLAIIAGANHRKVVIKRDDMGRITRITDDINRVVSYHYNKKGLLERVDDLGSNQWLYRYHNNQLLHKVIDPQGQQAAKFTFNQQHKAKTVKIRGQQYRYQYQDNITKAKDDNGGTSTFVQNDAGMTTSVTNAAGFHSSVVVNGQNQITELWHNGQQQAQFSYGTNGKLVTLDSYPNAPDNQQQYRYQYGTMGKVTAITGNDNTDISYTYDDRGNLTTREDNSGRYGYQYAANGDVLSEITTLTGQPAKTQTFSYSHDGLLSRLTEQQHTSAFSYNSAGKLSGLTFPNGANHQYSYDKLGFRTQTNRSDKSGLTYQYDSLGNLNTTNKIAVNQQSRTETLTVNKNNQLTQVDINSLTSTRAPLTIKYTGKGNPKSLKQGDHKIQYQYDKLGRLTHINDNISGQFDYDYQADESDIRLQLDDRTRPVQAMQSQINGHNQSQSSLLYARLEGTPWQAVVWQASLGKFLLLAPGRFNSPDAGYQSAKQRRRLYDALALTQSQQYDFDKPSNSFYLPAEYQTANCTYCFDDLNWTVDAPLTVNTYESVRLTASPIGNKKCEMFYLMEAEGQPAVYSASGIFKHSFTTGGRKEVLIRAGCQRCSWLSLPVIKLINVVKIPPPTVINIVLTFDDGPTSDSLNTSTVVNTLKYNEVQNDIKATFFVQTHVPNRGGSGKGRNRMIDALRDGHRIGIHTGSTVDHVLHIHRVTADPDDINGDEAQDELDGPNGLVTDLIRAKERIKNLIGGSVPTLVRPPEGEFNAAVSRVYAEQGLTNVLWDMSTEDDVKLKSPERVDAAIKLGIKTNIALGKTRIVILMHDIHGNTANNMHRYLKTIRDAVVAQGYYKAVFTQL